MSLSAIVYRNRSLREDERGAIKSVEPETGEPIIDPAQDHMTFAAREMFLGNISGIGELRWELEKIAPAKSEILRELVVSNGICGGNIIEPNILRIISECSHLLGDEELVLSEYLRKFLMDFLELAQIALDESNPIVIL